MQDGWVFALSLSLSLLLTQTMKNMFGKHRPDFLARCNPDIAGMNNYIVGGFTSEVLEGTSQLVNWQICISNNGSGVGTSEFIDGFRSFPSGHCTSSYTFNQSANEYLPLQLHLPA
jgi:membrane-associated phospholipid phosphatase